MLLAATDVGLAGVWFVGQKHIPTHAHWLASPEHRVLNHAIRELSDYFNHGSRSFTVSLDLRAGTAFQQAVWQALLAVEAGTTTSYGAIALALGKPGAARAVGAAIGRNPLSIIVPCHRVVGAGGALTGYAGGLERKTALLRHEGVL